MEPWEAYQIYLGLKLHFNSDYDYNRYDGRTSASKASFIKRKDRNFFAKVARKYGESTKDYFISNFVLSPKGWLGDFNETNYNEWIKYKQSLTYNFMNDMQYLFTQVEKFDEIFSCNSGQHPLLLKQFLAKRISLETMVILQSLVGYIKGIDKSLKGDIIWPDVRRLIVKYGAFLTFDREKCRVQLLKLTKEYF